jgi:hypothetical protein
MGLNDIDSWIDSIPKPKSLIKAYLKEKYNYTEVLKEIKESTLNSYDSLLISHCPYEGNTFIKDLGYRKKLNKTMIQSLIERSKKLGVNKDLSFGPTEKSLLQHLLYNEKVPVLDVYKHFPNIHPAIVLRKCLELNCGDSKTKQILNSRKQYWRKNDVNHIFNLSR